MAEVTVGTLFEKIGRLSVELDAMRERLAIAEREPEMNVQAQPVPKKKDK